jgi:hypothetical protein
MYPNRPLFGPSSPLDTNSATLSAILVVSFTPNTDGLSCSADQPAAPSCLTERMSSVSSACSAAPFIAARSSSERALASPSGGPSKRTMKRAYSGASP